MIRLGAIFRRFLLRNGYVLRRVETTAGPSLGECLRAICKDASLVCFSNDVGMQTEILAVFPHHRVAFETQLFLQASERSAADATMLLPSGPFIVVADISCFSLDVLFSMCERIGSAEGLLLCARLGSFWSGEIDVCRLRIELAQLGFEVSDAIGLSSGPSLHAPLDRVVFSCKGAGRSSQSEEERYRTNRAAAFLSAPLASCHDFRLLAGRGSFGYAAGVLNPGALVESGRVRLLVRTDRFPWALQKADESLFFNSSEPLLLSLGDDGHVSRIGEVSIEALPEAGASRIGDFRLFRFRQEVFTNHFVMTKPGGTVAARHPVRIDEMRMRVGISRLDMSSQRLIWCGFPMPDRPLAKCEKNWAMFTGDGRLFLLYSVDPYILLAASNWPEMAFKTVLQERFTFPFGNDGVPLRNSINPVDYDQRHWLHVVHKVYPSKQYVFWAVLIEKRTLEPVRATARPLVCGWQSFPASIIYACSAIARPSDILLFCGVDDSATAVATVPRARLDAEWVAIERMDAKRSRSVSRGSFD